MGKIKNLKSTKTQSKAFPNKFSSSDHTTARYLKSLKSYPTKKNKSPKIKSAKSKSSKVPKVKNIKTKSIKLDGSIKSAKIGTRRYLKKAKSNKSVKALKSTKVKSSKVPVLKKAKTSKSLKSGSAKSSKNTSF